MANQIVWFDVPKPHMDAYGFRATVLNSGGNRIALHSR